MDTEEAVEKAIHFLENKAGYLTHKLESIQLDKTKQEWQLRFDVGLFFVVIVDMRIDDETGRIIAYESPK